MADLYELLGVSRSATAEEIKRAYRRRARELHPDTNPDPHADSQFKELGRAYEVLSDPNLRARYDQFGEAGLSGPPPGGGAAFFGAGLDTFSSAFSGGGATPSAARRGPADPPRGQDLEVVA